MNEPLQNLTPPEELAFLRTIHDPDAHNAILSSLREDFQVIQTRAQILLSLVIICLTITGFSGRQIAESSDIARLFLGLGILAVLGSALVLFGGPLRLRWLTRTRAESMDATLVGWIERRNRRTRFYHIAVSFLLIGLSCYVLAVVAYVVATP